MAWRDDSTTNRRRIADLDDRVESASSESRPGAPSLVVSIVAVPATTGPPVFYTVSIASPSGTEVAGDPGVFDLGTATFTALCLTGTPAVGDHALATQTDGCWAFEA